MHGGELDGIHGTRIFDWFHLRLPEDGVVVDGLGVLAGECHPDQDSEDPHHLLEIVAVLENSLVQRDNLRQLDLVLDSDGHQKPEWVVPGGHRQHQHHGEHLQLVQVLIDSLSLVVLCSDVYSQHEGDDVAAGIPSMAQYCSSHLGEDPLVALSTASQELGSKG